MSARKSNSKHTMSLEGVKALCALKRIRGITGLAKLVPCSREAVYFAIERPGRYGRVYQRIEEILA